MVEYVLVVTAVLLVCIYFLNSSGSTMPGAVNASLNSIINEVNNLNGQITFPP